jgi:hypothetical protein
MPILQSIGGFFGGRIAADLESFIANPSQAIADGLNSLGKWASDGINFLLSDAMDWGQLGKDLIAGVILIFTDWNPGYHITKILMGAVDLMDWSSINASWDQVGKNIRSAIGTWFSDSLTNISFSIAAIGTSILNWFKDGLSKVVARWHMFWTWIGDWVWKGIDGISASWNSIWKWVKDWIWNGIQSISAKWSDIWGWLKDWIWNGLQSAADGLGSVLGFADGGQINEPIMGIGRSGQMYSFGENGSETVIPNGESGGSGITLNISVGNISSEGDMRNFETRVMDILENANSRRGRL